MEVEKKSGRGKKEVSLIGLFGKQFLEEMQNKLAEATGVSFFIIDYKGEPVTKGEKEEKFCTIRNLYLFPVKIAAVFFPRGRTGLCLLKITFKKDGPLPPVLIPPNSLHTA